MNYQHDQNMKLQLFQNPIPYAQRKPGNPKETKKYIEYIENIDTPTIISSGDPVIFFAISSDSSVDMIKGSFM